MCSYVLCLCEFVCAQYRVCVRVAYFFLCICLHLCVLTVPCVHVYAHTGDPARGSDQHGARCCQMLFVCGDDHLRAARLVHRFVVQEDRYVSVNHVHIYTKYLCVCVYT